MIVESDPSVGKRLVTALNSSDNLGFSTRFNVSYPSIQCKVIASQKEFFETDPRSWDLVVTGMELQDGSGFEVLSYVKGIRPNVSVIMTGMPREPAEVVEAIHAGVAEYLFLSGPEVITFPVMVNKCFAMQDMQHENEELHTELNRSLAELASKNHELEILVQRLEVVAIRDEMTSLYNRRWLNHTLAKRWDEAIRNNVPLAFMMIDLDDFKQLNDKYGHQRGDEVLCIAARVVESNCRSIDVAARYGGDELCVLMPHANSEEAVHAATRISMAFDLAMKNLEWLDEPTSLSIGVSHMQVTSPCDEGALIQQADIAMYKAKNDPDKNVALYSNEDRIAA